MTQEVKVRLKIETTVSLWQAIKLRIAGAEVIREYIAARLEDGGTDAKASASSV